MACCIKGDKHLGTCDHGEECCPHDVTGEIISCSNSISINGINIAVSNDKVSNNCPHCGTGYIIGSSSNIKINGQSPCKIGDTVIYPGGKGVITTASGNINL